MRILIVLGVFIFLNSPMLTGQSWRTITRDTIPTTSWDVDDFAESMESKKSQIIILSQEEVGPESYDSQPKPQIIREQELEVVNENAILRALPKNYTGFKVEIAKSEEGPLSEDEDIFFRHGNIIAAKTGEEKYSYMIGDFQEETKAQEFLDQNLLGHYPEARVIKYAQGVRLY